MKTLLAAAIVLTFATASFADIQDPPSNDHGPTRKLGRGLSNMLFGIAELPTTIAKVNEREGNSTAAGYGVVRGLGRSFIRFHAGLFEIFTFPFPTTHQILSAPSKRHSAYPCRLSGISARAWQRVEISIRADVLGLRDARQLES